MADIRERHITELVQVISEIVGGQTAVLQRVERALVEQYKAFAAIVERLNLVDKKVQGGFTVLENNRLVSIDQKVSEGLKKIDYSLLIKAKDDLDRLVSKMQKQVDAQLLQFVINQAKKPKKAPNVSAKRVRAITRGTGKSPIPRAPAYTAVVPQATTPITEEAVADVQGDDWTESELEGAQIFDSIITGWKRRDWESQAKGTKEMFMRAWKKLSNTDRQRIRNGAWSKKIINKMKLLSRD
jgi:hypothetical protein